jgi:hypothetical protein
MAGTGDDNSATIFVSIVAFRDTECQWTLRSLFEQAPAALRAPRDCVRAAQSAKQAERPLRVFAGVCWQYVPDEDAACFRWRGWFGRPLLRMRLRMLRGASWGAAGRHRSAPCTSTPTRRAARAGRAV